jgi:ABC-type polysaccharide/polyol phosphate export permease
MGYYIYSKVVNIISILKQFYLFLRDIIYSRHIILELTKNDFKSRYLGSYLGLVWVLVCVRGRFQGKTC